MAGEQAIDLIRQGFTGLVGLGSVGEDGCAHLESGHSGQGCNGFLQPRPVGTIGTDQNAGAELLDGPHI